MRAGQQARGSRASSGSQLLALRDMAASIGGEGSKALAVAPVHQAHDVYMHKLNGVAEPEIQAAAIRGTMKMRQELVTDYEPCEDSTLVAEDRCRSGDPPIGMTGRKILIPNEYMKTIFTPLAVAEKLIRQRRITIPHDTFQAMLDELDKRAWFE